MTDLDVLEEMLCYANVRVCGTFELTEVRFWKMNIKSKLTLFQDGHLFEQLLLLAL